MKTLPQLEKLTIQWAHDRGILQNGKATTQCLKLVSEAGELAEHIADGTDTRDDIGDCLVVLCNICGITDSHSITYHNHKINTELNLWTLIGTLADNIIKNRPLDMDIEAIVQALNELAEDAGSTLEECWAYAYNDIKDRKGFLNEHGNFVKEADENYEQLLMDFQCNEAPTITHYATSLDDNGIFQAYVKLDNGTVDFFSYAIDDVSITDSDMDIIIGKTIDEAKEYVDRIGDVV